MSLPSPSCRPGDGDGGAPEFSWSRLGATASSEAPNGAQPPAWVAAAQRCGGSTGATPPPAPASHQRLAVAAAVAKKCLDLGLPRLAVLPRATPQQLQQQQQQQQQPDQILKQEQAAAAAQRQLAQATSQLQKQSTVLASALESQSAQLARQQQLLHEVVQGMLFVVAKAGSSGAAPPCAAAPAAAHSAPAAPAQHSRQQQLHSVPQPAARPPAHCRKDEPCSQAQQSARAGGQQQASALLQDLANIVARQSAQLQRGSCLPQHTHTLPDASMGAAVEAAHSPSYVPKSPRRLPLQRHGAAAAEQPAPCQEEIGRATPRLNRAAQLRMGAVRPSMQQGHQGEAALTAVPRASRGGSSAEGGDAGPPPSSIKRALHGGAKPGWDDSTVVQRPSPAAKRVSRLDDPPERQRQPAGASASLAAQLLMQVRCPGVISSCGTWRGGKRACSLCCNVWQFQDNSDKCSRPGAKMLAACLSATTARFVIPVQELKKYRLRQRPRPAAARQPQQQEAHRAVAPTASSGPRLPAHGMALPQGLVQHALNGSKAKEVAQPHQGGHLPVDASAMSNEMQVPDPPEQDSAPAEAPAPCSAVDAAMAGSHALQQATPGCSDSAGVSDRTGDPTSAGMTAAVHAACSCGSHSAVGGGLAAAGAAGEGSAAEAPARETPCAKVGHAVRHQQLGVQSCVGM